MPRATPLQASTNAGEFGPRMVARTDFVRYPFGCAALENMIPLPQGGAARRPGTRFVAALKDENRTARLIPFQFSTEQSYVLELGDGHARIYMDGGQVVAGPVAASVTNGDFTAGIAGWVNHSTGAASLAHDSVHGRLELVGATGGIAWAGQAIATANAGSSHVVRFVVSGVAGDGVELRIGTTATGREILANTTFAVGSHCLAFTPTAAVFHLQFRNQIAKTVRIDDVAILTDAPVEIATPWREDELMSLKFVQSADVMYVCHRQHGVRKITRSGHASWSVTEASFFDGPWLEENVDAAKTLTPSALTGLGITITAAGHAPFDAADIGHAIRIRHGATWGHAIVTEVVTPQQVRADVRSDFAALSASSGWRLGAWSARSGFPAALAFFEQRLVFAGTTRQPQTLWMSQSADFENMRPDDGADAVEDDDAIDFTISADQVNAIQWLIPGRNLVMGTTGGEWLIGSNGSLITPSDIEVRRHTAFGSAGLAPREMQGRLVFVQRAGRKVLEFAYSLDRDTFQALDLTLLADHVTRGGLVDLAYQQEPDSVLWCVRRDGVVPTLTYQPDQNVVGWARQIPGGISDTGAPVVESVAVIPTPERDQVWLICRRLIDGAVRRYIEALEPPFEGGDDPARAVYVDCAIRYEGEAASSIGGAAHLEGERVSILADGAIHPPRIVVDGTVQLDYPAECIVLGLPYRHTYESLKWEAGAVAGTAQGQVKRIHGVTLVLLDSVNAAVGPSGGALKAMPFRDVADAMDGPVPLFTGERYVEFDADYATDTRIVISGADPVPFTLLAVAPELRTNSR
ncbi:MAG: hypothetical protein U1E97_02695 [Alphaproteobacteria bacterium]